MATTLEHSEAVLAGILPNRKDLLDIAMRRLTPDHFPDRRHANLFKMIEKYSDTVNSVLPRQYLDDLMKHKIEESQYILYLEIYDHLASTKVETEDFIWSVEQLRELAAEKATGEAITEAMEILKKGKELKPGHSLKGHEDARLQIIERLSSIDQELHQVDAVEGIVQDEYDEIIQDYADIKAKRESGETMGIGFGIEALDDVTGGMQRGELTLVAASTSHGKSSLAAQSAWFAATQQGKNVVFFATETGRNQIRRKLISRHSKLEAFGLPDGLNLRDLKRGTLSEKEEIVFKDVTSDLANNSKYGKIHLAQVPNGATINTLEHKINRISRNFGVDFVVMDYLALLNGVERVSEDRTKYINILRSAKLVAASAAEGLGVPFLSPWQMNRTGRSGADSTGYYTVSDLSETSEAEKITDLLIALYRNDDETGRFAEGNIQIMKARDGERMRDILIDIDYATSTFTSRQGLRAHSGTQRESGWGGLDSIY